MIRRVLARWRRWRAGRKMRAWRRRLPEHVVVERIPDWALEREGAIVDVASWTMPPRRQWPVAFPQPVGWPGWLPPVRVAPDPRGPQAVRIVSKAPDGETVAYEVVR